MKYCSKCGKEIMDEAVICVNCGCQVSDKPINTPNTSSTPNTPTEGGGIALAALIFAFIVPIVGFILGIVGACKYKMPSGRGISIAAIFLSIFMWFISFVILSGLGWFSL